MNWTFKYLGGSKEPTTISRIANVLFNHTLVRFVNYLIIEIYSLSKYIKKIGNREMGNLEIFVESRKLLYYLRIIATFNLFFSII